MCKPQPIVCFYLTFALTALCNIISGQKLEILPTQPEQTKPIGKPLLLTCKADDPRAITDLHWTDNHGKTVDKLIYGSKRSPMYTEVLPDSGVTLFITSLTKEMAGEYTCVGTHANTENLKASVTINTIYPISWVDAPENQYPIINTDYKIRCHVKAEPAASVDWLKDGETISTNTKYVTEPTGLWIKNVQESDDGTYCCRAAVMSTGELDTRYIKVEVQIPPRIEPIDPVEVIEGNDASIQCRAFGKPPPTYTWIKESTKEDLSKTQRFKVEANTGLLIIKQVQNDDNTSFICEAKNSANRTHTVVSVKVLIKPKIEELRNITSPENRTAEMICKVRGRPAPTILFRKFGTRQYYTSGQQPTNDKIIFEQKIQEDGEETFGYLTFTKLNRSDDGLYECAAQNPAGEIWKNGHITVEFKPTFASSKNQPPVWSWNNRPGNLSCLAESIPNATIEWRRNDEPIRDDGKIFRIINKGPQSFLIVYPHNDRRLYTQYKCIATNKLGQDVHFVELRLGVPPEAVQQASLHSLTATTIQFDIIGPAIRDGLPVKAFIVQYKEERQTSWMDAKNKTWSVDSPYILENLEPEKTYNFRFAAYNDVGIGGYGAPQSHTMSRRSAPNEPSILSTPEEGVVTSPYAEYFQLRWKVPANNGEPIDNYLIKFCPVRRVNGDWVPSADGCNTEELSGVEYTECRISPLRADTHYKIELRAHNAIGYSTPAELIVKTARGEHYYRYYNHACCSVCASSHQAFAFVLVPVLSLTLLVTTRF